jgi:hypothetical protein
MNQFFANRNMITSGWWLVIGEGDGNAGIEPNNQMHLYV